MHSEVRFYNCFDFCINISFFFKLTCSTFSIFHFIYFLYNLFVERSMLSCVDLKGWVIICTERDAQGVDNLVRTMQRVAGPLDFQLAQPLDV